MPFAALGAGIMPDPVCPPAHGSTLSQPGHVPSFDAEFEAPVGLSSHHGFALLAPGAPVNDSAERRPKAWCRTAVDPVAVGSAPSPPEMLDVAVVP